MFAELALGPAIFLVLALALALSFEFVNGFHDTANAVATVIYTHSLRPTAAVVWSGLWNLIGVLTSSGAVAFGVVALLPVELILNVGSAAGFAMIFSLLLSAILWNLGTWYLGLPASSSHTMIGAIMGVGLANAMHHAGARFGDGVNWSKAREVGASLLISPLVGFFLAAGLLLLMRVLIQRAELYQEPAKDQPPPLWVRAILIFTCTGVSFAHGSNDGQKGMGLILLILIGALPGQYALNHAADPATVARIAGESEAAQGIFEKHSTPAALASQNRAIAATLRGPIALQDLPAPDRTRLRTSVYLVSEALADASRARSVTATAEIAALDTYERSLDSLTRYIPVWVKFAVALALGLGTMIGWQRIVVTVGEKIGKTHLSYAQGAAAELVAAGTIGAADLFGLPVSTTHVLSSGVAGTMAANRSGLQMNTLRNLLLAWILTLPVCVFLGAMLLLARSQRPAGDASPLT